MGAKLTTGIGSLPFRTVDSALQHVFTHYDIPFLPQLPRLQGGRDPLVPMLREALTPRMRDAIERREPDALAAALDEGAEDPRIPMDLVRFHPAVAGFLRHLPGSGAAKLQMIGPVAFATLVAAELGATAPDLFEPRAWLWTQALARAWVEVVRGVFAGPLTLLWDDGLLAATSRRPGIETFHDLRIELLDRAVTLGLHTCAPCELDRLRGVFEHTLLAVDLSVTDLESAHYRRSATAHVAAGGAFFFGIVDTQADHVDVKRARSLAHVASEISGDRTTVLTGGCGTGLRTEEFERDMAAALRLACSP